MVFARALLANWLKRPEDAPFGSDHVRRRGVGNRCLRPDRPGLERDPEIGDLFLFELSVGGFSAGNACSSRPVSAVSSGLPSRMAPSGARLHGNRGVACRGVSPCGMQNSYGPTPDESCSRRTPLRNRRLRGMPLQTGTRAADTTARYSTSIRLGALIAGGRARRSSPSDQRLAQFW